jgi:hypothetical protein
VVAVLLKLETGVFPKGCGGPAGAAPNGTGVGAGVVEPNAIGAPNPGTAAGVEPNVVDDCAGVVEPKFIALEGAGVDPNPELGPAAGVEPKVIGAAGAGAVEPNAGATGAGVDPNENGAAGAGAGVDPKESGATGAGVEPKVGAGLGAGGPDAARELLEVFPNDGGAAEDPKPEVGTDELSFVGFVDGFPNTKGAGVTACAGASLDVLDPNDMVG